MPAKGHEYSRRKSLRSADSRLVIKTEDVCVARQRQKVLGHDTLSRTPVSDVANNEKARNDRTRRGQSYARCHRCFSFHHFEKQGAVELRTRAEPNQSQAAVHMARSTEAVKGKGEAGFVAVVEATVTHETTIRSKAEEAIDAVGSPRRPLHHAAQERQAGLEGQAQESGRAEQGRRIGHVGEAGEGAAPRGSRAPGMPISSSEGGELGDATTAAIAGDVGAAEVAKLEARKEEKAHEQVPSDIQASMLCEEKVRVRLVLVERQDYPVTMYDIRCRAFRRPAPSSSGTCTRTCARFSFVREMNDIAICARVGPTIGDTTHPVTSHLRGVYKVVPHALRPYARTIRRAANQQRMLQSNQSLHDTLMKDFWVYTRR